MVSKKARGEGNSNGKQQMCGNGKQEREDGNSNGKQGVEWRSV